MHQSPARDAGRAIFLPAVPALLHVRRDQALLSNFPPQLELSDTPAPMPSPHAGRRRRAFLSLPPLSLSDPDSSSGSESITVCGCLPPGGQWERNSWVTISGGWSPQISVALVAVLFASTFVSRGGNAPSHVARMPGALHDSGQEEGFLTSPRCWGSEHARSRMKQGTGRLSSWRAETCQQDGCCLCWKMKKEIPLV